MCTSFRATRKRAQHLLTLETKFPCSVFCRGVVSERQLHIPTGRVSLWFQGLQVRPLPLTRCDGGRCLPCSRLVGYVWDREGLKLERGAACRSDEVCDVRHRGELRMEAAGRAVGLACAPQRERQLPAAERRATRAAAPVPGLCPGVFAAAAASYPRRG